MYGTSSVSPRLSPCFGDAAGVNGVALDVSRKAQRILPLHPAKVMPDVCGGTCRL